MDKGVISHLQQHLQTFLIFASLIVKQLYFLLIFISPIIGKVEHLFMCLWTTFISCYKILLFISVFQFFFILFPDVIFTDL